ncbi:hypothetical protein F5Y13DRAFT_164439 [Hypoxylon sp. FL1857]|nr:hypothetical protein F5Y13DRAFT_164439 [Hypoxylon sp. FL1857]
MGPLSVYVVLDTLHIAITAVRFTHAVESLVEDTKSTPSLDNIRRILTEWSGRLRVSVTGLPNDARNEDTNISDIARLSQLCRVDCDELLDTVQKLIADNTPIATIESTQEKQFASSFTGPLKTRQHAIEFLAINLVRYC